MKHLKKTFHLRRKKMKKLLMLIAISVIVGGAVFAQESEGEKAPAQKKSGGFGLSIGGGGLFSADFTSWTAPDLDPKDSMDQTTAGGGFGLFFDATYVEVDLAMVFGSTKYNNKDSEKLFLDDKSINQTALRIGALGKYPISLSDKVTFFPLLGLDYHIVLNATLDGEDPYKDKKDADGNDMTATGELSALWIKLGVGADFALTDKLFLRGEFLYGLGLNNKSERDQIKSWKDNDTTATALDHGLDVKVLVGYKL
jgi:opacity protein-like surface antigen